MIPLQILLPWVISKYTTGPKPMDVYLKAFPCRLLMGLVFALVVHITPDFMNSDGSFPLYYYGLLLFVYALHQVSKKRGQIIQKSPKQNERHFNFSLCIISWIFLAIYKTWIYSFLLTFSHSLSDNNFLSSNIDLICIAWSFSGLN